MEAKKFIDIFTKKDFRKEVIEDLKKEFSQYPYFSPIIIAYLLSLRLNDDPNFRNELIKYSHYISNKRKFIELLFEIEIIKERLKDRLTPEEAERLEKEIYLRAKQKHEQIIHEIIEPKINKLRQLSQIAKSQKLTQPTKEKTTPQQEEKEVTLNVNVTDATKSTPVKEKESTGKPGITETKPTTEKVVSDAEEKKVNNQQPVAEKQETQKPVTEEKKEPTQRAKSITITPPPEPPTSQETSALEEEETHEEKSTAVTIDDIFKKIEELKKKKLEAKDQFKQRVTTIDKLLDEHKSREEVTTSPEHKTNPKPTQDKETQPVIKTEKETQEKTTGETTQEAEQKAEPQAQEETPGQDKTTPVQTEEKQVSDKTIAETKETTSIETKQESYNIEPDEIIEFDMGEETQAVEEEKTQAPETEIKQEKKQEATTTGQELQEKKSAETIKDENKTEMKSTGTQEAKEHTVTETPKTQPQAPEDQQKTGTTEKKSAADRILEEIRRRRQMKKQQDQLIDKFLKEQPTIDKTRKPSIEGDLSEPATKDPDLVTEKMARIYEMQELYDKAIATYEKLILKFPEKSDYFAQKIEELKKKLK